MELEVVSQRREWEASEEARQHINVKLRFTRSSRLVVDAQREELLGDGKPVQNANQSFTLPN